jgi:type I restriction enzyme R subunit
LNEVVEYLVKNGVMEPKEMFDAPFTHFHDQGVTGVLGEEMAKNVVELVRAINANASVA